VALLQDPRRRRSPHAGGNPGLDVAPARISSGGEPYPFASARGRRNTDKQHNHEHNANKPPKKMLAKNEPKNFLGGHERGPHQAPQSKEGPTHRTYRVSRLKQWLEESHGTEVSPLPVCLDQGIGFSPRTLAVDGNYHDASKEDRNALRH
jgi:hypothetical protein